MRKWIAVLLILCLAVGSLAGCKSEDEKKTASAGGYVEGSADVGGDEVTIVDNQGGGVGNTSNSGDQGGDADLDQDTEQDTDTNKGNTDTDKGNTNTDKGNTNTDKGNTNTDKGNTDTNTDQNNGTDDKKEPEQDETEPEEGEDEDDVDYKPENKIKILDYNLRCADDDNGRSIAERAVRFREVMKKYTPDICGFQEIVPKWVTHLSADYPEYGSHIEYRSTSSKEGTMVMWNTKTMELVECGHFWLSPTPDVMSKGDAWGETQFYRIVAWAKVKVKATGSAFVYFSTHQNNAGTHPANSAKTILNYAKKLGVGSKFGGFCMGDYNIEPWTPGYVAMINNGEGPFNDINADLDNLSDVTNHGYHNSDNPHIIDYIFYTPAKVHPLHYEVVDMEIDGNYVSDHRGLYAEAALLY